MMNCKHTCTITTVQFRHKRTMKLLILWLNVLATGETELDLNTGKKYSLINHLTYCSFEKKKKKSRPLTILLDFFQVWKIAGQTLDLFANSRLHTNPVMKRGKSKGEAGWLISRYLAKIKSWQCSTLARVLLTFRRNCHCYKISEQSEPLWLLLYWP